MQPVHPEGFESLPKKLFLNVALCTHGYNALSNASIKVHESYVFKKPQVAFVTNFHKIINCRKNNCFKISIRIKTCKLQNGSCFLARITIQKSKRGSLPFHTN